LLLLLPQDAPFNCFWDDATRVQYYCYREKERDRNGEKNRNVSVFSPPSPPSRLFGFTTHAWKRLLLGTHHIVYVVYTLLIYNLYCIISYPNDSVEFGHGYLFRSFHSRGYLLLVLQLYTKQMYNTVWIHDFICHTNDWTYF